jgi:hypothetical protein
MFLFGDERQKPVASLLVQVAPGIAGQKPV